MQPNVQSCELSVAVYGREQGRHNGGTNYNWGEKQLTIRHGVHLYQVIEITVVELDDRGAMVRHFKKLARYLEGKDLAKRIEEDSSWFERCPER